MPTYEPVESPDSTTVFPYHDLTPPTIEDVYAARKRIASQLPRTPVVKSEELSAEFDADVYLKREDTLPTGAFKVRGGLNLAAGLDEAFHDPGLIAASTGNHGQSVAYAGRTVDVPVLIGVPEDANPSKVRAMERLGARVERHGADFDEAREWVETRAAKEGYRYVHSANEPSLVAGVATAGLEIVEDRPEVDYLFSPIGGGSSASGYCLTVGQLTDAAVIGVQSAGAPAMHRAWTDGDLAPLDRMETFAEGLATRAPFALTTDLLRDHLDDFLLVDDDDLEYWMRRAFEADRIVFEGASAAALAGIDRLRDEIAGKTVVLPVSGSNVSMEKFRNAVF